jgi:hypothetical protein
MNYAPGPRSSNSHNAPPVGALPHFALPPRVPQRGFNPNVPPDMMEMDGGEGAFGGYGGAPQAPGLPQPGTDYPTGEFDPSDSQPQPWKNKEVEIWAHDDQVAAGKTYRYKMRYKLKNPIFGTNAGDPATLGEQFALISEFSPWTTPITVPSLVNFFVAGGGLGGRNTVEFEIYRWDQGQQKVERFSVSPGDVVGWAKNGVDFSTDWTVVDFREDARANDRQILLVNNKDGKVVARSFQADAKDKLYEALKKQVKDAKAAENTAAAAGGATVGGTAAAR